MVRVFYFFLLLPALLFSAEFVATVNRTELSLGESFTLSLTLKDVSAKSSPFLEELRNNFTIHSQQQAQNTVIRNGVISSNITWKVTLIPQKEGEETIPSVSIETPQGTLSTQPIKIQVSQGKPKEGEATDSNGMIISMETSHSSPYKNESLILKIRLTTKRDLANVKMDKLMIENAIVEEMDEPKVTQTILNGKNVARIEFSYLITPLKAGTMKIPSTVIQGMVFTKGNAPRHLQAFSMMFEAMDRLEPFTIASGQMDIEVQAPVSEVDPWLPAKSLQLEEITHAPQPLRVGEPFTREFKIIAEGVTANQLPNLADRTKTSAFKIYADKPETSETFNRDTIQSSRKEQYTYIPQQPGDLTLPEVSIEWWDVNKKEKTIASIPAKTVNILPAVVNRSWKAPSPQEEQQPLTNLETPRQDSIFYGIIAILTTLLLGMMIWNVVLLKRSRTMAHHNKKAPLKYSPFSETYEELLKEKKEKLSKLNPT